MKKKYTTFILLSWAFLTACQTTNKHDTIKNEPADRISGNWEGIIPCDDCTGMEYMLELKNNGVFREKLSNIFGEKKTIKNTGKWNLSGDTLLVLNGSASGYTRYRFEQNELSLLESDIKENNQQEKYTYHYSLKRDMKRSLSGRKNRKYKKGVFFVAKGREPSWSLEVHDNNTIDLITSEFRKSTLSEKISDSTALLVFPDSILIKTPKTTLRILEEYCVERESGEAFGYKVEVTAGNSNSEPEVYKGCGEFLSDKRLNDSWSLQTLNGKEMPAGIKDKAGVEFHFQTGRLYGCGGCNNFHARADIRGNSIIVGPVVYASKDCPENASEAAFLNALSGKQFIYSFKGRKLYLDNDMARMVFSRAGN